MNILNLNVLRSRIATWLFLALVASLLAGCFGAAAIGVGAGSLFLADRRTSDTYLTDEAIEIRAANRINEKFGDKVHVNVTSYNRTLLLTGEVPDAATKTEIEKVINDVPNLKAFQNELQVSGISSLTARSNDVYITSKVKGRFMDASKFPPYLVKVVTESGSVYLLGLVTQQEADAAVEIARTTGGVLKVVRVFEIISAAKAKQLDNTPPPAPAKPEDQPKK